MGAFFELKTALISEPWLSFPRSDRKFTLIVDSAIGSATTPGGIGAILCQTDELGHLSFEFEPFILRDPHAHC